MAQGDGSSDPVRKARTSDEVCDVLVLGGGVMGCAVAWRLAQAGVRVTVVERAESPGAEATTAAAGMLAAQIEAEQPGPFLDLLLHGRARYPRWDEELREETGLSIGYDRCGALVTVSRTAGDAHVARELAALRARCAWQQDAGLRVEWLDRAALAAAEPGLHGAAALRCPDDAQVEPARLIAALSAAMQGRGVRLVRGTALRIDLDPSGSRAYGATLADRRIAAAQVVLALGSWSSLLPGTPLPAGAVTPVRGQMLELGPAELGSGPGSGPGPGSGLVPPLRHLVFGQVAAPPALAGSDAAFGSDADPGALRGGYLVPRADGRVVVGSTMEHTGFRKEVTADGILHLLHLARTLAPGLGAAPLLRTWAGLRPGSPDGMPLVGPTHVAGLSVCTGHFRNGILLAPLSAEVLCAQLLGGDKDPAAKNRTSGFLSLLPLLSPSRLGTDVR